MRWIAEAVRGRWKVALGILGAFAGMQFAMFIIEEALQTVMFSSWIEKSMAREHAQLIADAYYSILLAGRSITYIVGWAVPPMYVAYNAYWISAETWLTRFCAAYEVVPSQSWSWLRSFLLSSVLVVLLVGVILKMPRPGSKEAGRKGGAW